MAPRAHRSRADEVLAAWLAHLDGHGDRRHPGLTEAAADVVWAVVETPARLPDALTRLGRWAGAAGWTLHEVTSWLDRLGPLTGHPGRRLEGFEAGTALGAGWSERYLHGHQAADSLDPVSGLGQLSLLRHRLHEQAAVLAELDLTLGQTATLAVVDVGLARSTPLTRAAALAALGARVRSVFDTGEPAARTGHRVIVLASRGPSTQARLDQLLAEAAGEPALAGCAVLGWLEPLPDDPRLLDALVADLVPPA